MPHTGRDRHEHPARHPSAAELDAWLAPLDESDPCGPDLEYDNDFLDLVQAVAGKPETQFAAAEAPDWSAVQQGAEQLSLRTRDLRIAGWWLRARLRTEGFAALPAGLQLMVQLLSQWWDELHPRLDDDGDAFARANVLAEFASLDSLLGDVRQALVLDDRTIGQVSVRDIEIAQGRLAARDDETPLSAAQIEQMLRDAARDDPALATRATEARAALAELEQLFADRTAGTPQPDFAPLQDMLDAVAALSPTIAAATDDLEPFDFDTGSADVADEPAPRRPHRPTARSPAATTRCVRSSASAATCRPTSPRTPRSSCCAGPSA